MMANDQNCGCTVRSLERVKHEIQYLRRQICAIYIGVPYATPHLKTTKIIRLTDLTVLISNAELGIGFVFPKIKRGKKEVFSWP